MLDLRFVRENIDLLKEKLALRGEDLDLNPFIQMDQERRDLIQKADALRSQRNQVSDEISKIKQEGGAAEDLVAQMRQVGQEIKELETVLREREEKLQDFLLTIPNIPHESVPVGKSAEDNKEISQWGEPPKFSFEPKPHWDIGET
ncbi:MAG: serine--tRNA ligase, partial [Deltaproteobacteria bacterium]